MHLKKQVDLQFNVAQLLREPVGGRREYTFDEENLSLDNDVSLQKITGDVRFTRTPSGVLTEARVRGVVERLCTRCLDQVDQSIALHFCDEFHSKIEVNTGAPLPQPDEEDPFFINENHLVDVGQAIREYTLIELPMQALCRGDCKGLCPTCGVNLNDISCDCPSGEEDERLSILKSLLD
ncbi:MAG: hypothetical protein GFH23_1086718n30 [Chloroflexi bacterium AL-N1]|nr:hypothetical protein [Chloroflexi bacterium AL-N1]NOK77315.1 hypothetical protein [Chloroflexi bacterium AL-N5]